MELSNLTTSGWVLFAVTAVSWLGLIANLVALRSRRNDININVRPSVVVTAILTVWLLWLVTP